jgi:hypothetical protein
MLDSNLIEFYKSNVNYKDVESIVEHAFGKSLIELKHDNARKNWKYPFFMHTWMQFRKKYGIYVVESLNQYKKVLTDLLNKEYEEFNLDITNKKAIDSIRFTKNETNKIMTKMMHDCVPGTESEKSFIDLNQDIEKFIDNQCKELVDTIKNEILNVPEYPDYKRTKMDELAEEKEKIKSSHLNL